MLNYKLYDLCKTDENAALEFLTLAGNFEILSVIIVITIYLRSFHIQARLSAALFFLIL
ncbi:MAG: hypothetical protein P8M71_02290 [Pseudomonadales bacterium]|nr:hypothetical protein [Pseudomonadales bacterium]